ncbi:MAG: hypothetical protein ABIT01_06720 [Thermoanaerobaculia bacterium]
MTIVDMRHPNEKEAWQAFLKLSASEKTTSGGRHSWGMAKKAGEWPKNVTEQSGAPHEQSTYPLGSATILQFAEYATIPTCVDPDFLPLGLNNLDEAFAEGSTGAAGVYFLASSIGIDGDATEILKTLRNPKWNAAAYIEPVTIDPRLQMAAVGSGRLATPATLAPGPISYNARMLPEEGTTEHVRAIKVTIPRGRTYFVIAANGCPAYPYAQGGGAYRTSPSKAAAK